MITTLNADQIEELKILQRKVHHHCGQNYLKIKTVWGTVTFEANENETFLNSIAKAEPKTYALNLPNRTA